MNKIFIGTPCYGGMITADYFKSCMQLVALATTNKTEIHAKTLLIKLLVEYIVSK